MPATDITPFTDAALDEAAALLAERHARDRAHSPLLPARFSDPAAARGAVAAEWGREHTSGVVARLDGALVGYLLGELRIDTHRGRNAWVQLPSHALAAGQPADLIADLYAAAARTWVSWGAFDHYAVLPANDTAGLESWFGLSFGQEQAMAARSLNEPLPAAPALPPDIDIRLADQRDAGQLIDELAPVVSRHMTQAPVWNPALPEHAQPRREGFAALLAADDVEVWAAFENGRMLAYQMFLPVTSTDDNLLAPEAAVLLELAATRPGERGRGLARALSARGLASSRARGFTTCLIDWRTTNREARRFWLAQGFQPTAYRLIRRLDPRIAWAGPT